MAGTGHFDKHDAPPAINAAGAACENLLKSLRKLRNRGQASDDDVEDARQARDLVRQILARTNWRNDGQEES